MDRWLQESLPLLENHSWSPVLPGREAVCSPCAPWPSALLTPRPAASVNPQCTPKLSLSAASRLCRLSLPGHSVQF